MMSVSLAATTQERPLGWHWLILWPNGESNGTIDQGTAEVRFQGRNFTASMNNGEILLKGTISGTQVSAIETVIGTDREPFVVHGDIQKVRTRLSDPSNGWGWDRISLAAPGGFYVSLFRKVRSGAAPGKTPQE